VSDGAVEKVRSHPGSGLPFVGVDLVRSYRYDANRSVVDKALQVRIWDHMSSCHIPVFERTPVFLFNDVNNICRVYNQFGFACPAWLRALYVDHMLPDDVVVNPSTERSHLYDYC